MTARQLAARIDHTILKPETTAGDVEALCQEALRYGCASVCVTPNRVAQAAALLDGSDVKVCTVVGFPAGTSASEIKAHEAALAVSHGATEIDMVINVGALKDGDPDTVRDDVLAVRRAIGTDVTLKAILESAALTEDELRAAVHAAVDGGTDYVKTSTGFHPAGGASLDAVRIMRAEAPAHVKVKASGGIRDTDTALEMIAAGADRLGLSATRPIVDGLDSGGSQQPAGTSAGSY